MRLLIFMLAAVASAAPTLAPRHPAVPPGTASNPIDLFLQRHFQQHGVTPSATVSDAIFARRAYLDALGSAPQPRAIESIRRGHTLRQAPAPGARTARRSPQVCRALDQFLERSAAQRRRRDLPRRCANPSATGCFRRSRATCRTTASCALLLNPTALHDPEGLPHRRQLARHGERQPDSGDAGGAEHARRSSWASISNAIPATTVSSASGNSPMLTDWPASSPMRRSMSTAATNSPAPMPTLKFHLSGTGQRRRRMLRWSNARRRRRNFSPRPITAASPAPSSIASGIASSAAASCRLWTIWMASLSMPTCSTGSPPTSPITTTTSSS